MLCLNEYVLCMDKDFAAVVVRMRNGEGVCVCVRAYAYGKPNV